MSRIRRTPLVVAGIAAVLVIGLAPAADAKQKGKIHVCVAKKGPNKGVMRFSKAKKCRKGEKSLSWNKRGQAGAPGQPGQTGPAGPTGGASEDTITELRHQIELQTAQISDLKDELADVSAQYTALLGQVTGLGTQMTGLSGQFSSFQTTACGQLTDLTDQSNDLGTALDGITLGGTIPIGLNLISPAAPTALSAFSC